LLLGGLVRRSITLRGFQRGFSLPELAIVLAVTAVLAGLVASAYRTHVVRSQISQSLEVAGHAETRIAQFFERDGEPPADSASAGLARDGSGDHGPYVDSLDVIDGRIDLHFGAGADTALTGRTLSLTPFESADRDVFWICGNRVASAGLRPLGFANGARQAVQVVTQIEPRYLPSACR
jgi:prepilin-type N-terminal cleavage/methylation domain-containing protein